MGPGPLCLRTGSPPPGTQDGGGFCGSDSSSVCSQNGVVRKGESVQCLGRRLWCVGSGTGKGRRSVSVSVCVEGKQGLPIVSRSSVCGEHRSGVPAPCPKAAPPHVPTRPGSCAGVGVAALFPSSRDLPDDVLTFIKAHPLLDPTVPPATHQPLLTLTSRYGANRTLTATLPSPSLSSSDPTKQITVVGGCTPESGREGKPSTRQSPRLRGSLKHPASTSGLP